MQLDGLPAHPLVVHFVIAAVLAAALAALALALVGRWRWLLRWAAFPLAALATGTVVVARSTGADLLEERYPDQVPPLIAQHQDHALVLLWIVVALAAATLVAWFALPAATPLASRRGAVAGWDASWLRWLVLAALVVTAVLSVVWLYRTGDAGARSVRG